ncbi:MAG: hypothetical protein IKX13_01560, partial [Bacteroidales bacterium]|nr:hypothetical protein [Bacteroidales bacterium]
HCLNQKMTAKLYAREVGKRYEDLNLIIAHLGGGVSVGIHNHGRVVEVAPGLMANILPFFCMAIIFDVLKVQR